MNCISPPELDDQQLSAYLDGMADAQVVEHLQRCPYCRQKAQALARWQDRLKARLYRITCPPSLELGEYHLGMFAGARAMAIAKHIVECPHCAHEVEQLRDDLRDEAPDSEKNPVKQAGEELKSYLNGFVNVIIGQVIGGFKPAFVGVRGGGRAPITIEAEGLHIVLDVQAAAEGRATLLGQIASEDIALWTGAQVELWQAGEPQRTAAVDDIGTFHFEGVLPAPTEILITSLSGKAISVPNLAITI